ncbi:nuclear transport factor 2 family protein [Pseudomonas sp. 5P_5.1_Bac1]|uniref:nuclear transport factor 2 family protein n=1 Tax=Pseudomonas sp. 5P_5.1_Bac1 TaxID=2971616 RepID=UPI0021CA6877|nr:nuclear transport factor 2 family protein [Pseudomonas sp. 5P_5.1_Bac1]MCU1720535.1 nuclear transport factor 2 family protein [Pseudomonas sp. 5P_5.1_Bac1]
MTDSAVAISNLLYQYAERLDCGDFEGAAALFRHARIKLAGDRPTLDSAQMLAVMRDLITLYPCGTPRTKHVTSNPIIEVDEAANRATVRSYYTVFQCTEGLPLQPITAGRYHDEFERVDGVWRFSFRDYGLQDAVGEMGFHLRGEG